MNKIKIEKMNQNLINWYYIKSIVGIRLELIDKNIIDRIK